ncbi:hypothetical protein EXIGLDRAFT_170761 [Exidia glandulosa HHB12029]|uniref:Uncharacterized protein n=1 Tax=Exidia glandulosa HHB12029 TaxID=1314781 RepID=A0A165FAS5_EXIGL|nr:hypothetical protein EXIGLDRAFT_170761 [Exidia glandulosa HHB12029]
MCAESDEHLLAVVHRRLFSLQYPVISRKQGFCLHTVRVPLAQDSSTRNPLPCTSLCSVENRFRLHIVRAPLARDLLNPLAFNSLWSVGFEILFTHRPRASRARLVDSQSSFLKCPVLRRKTDFVYTSSPRSLLQPRDNHKCFGS